LPRIKKTRGEREKKKGGGRLFSPQRDRLWEKGGKRDTQSLPVQTVSPIPWERAEKKVNKKKKKRRKGEEKRCLALNPIPYESPESLARDNWKKKKGKEKKGGKKGMTSLKFLSGPPRALVYQKGGRGEEKKGEKKGGGPRDCPPLTCAREKGKEKERIRPTISLPPVLKEIGGGKGEVLIFFFQLSFSPSHGKRKGEKGGGEKEGGGGGLAISSLLQPLVSLVVRTERKKGTKREGGGGGRKKGGKKKKEHVGFSGSFPRKYCCGVCVQRKGEGEKEREEEKGKSLNSFFKLMPQEQGKEKAGKGEGKKERREPLLSNHSGKVLRKNGRGE